MDYGGGILTRLHTGMVWFEKSNGNIKGGRAADKKPLVPDSLRAWYDTATAHAVIINLWYAYPWGYEEDRLRIGENIGDGGKHQKKKGVKIKTPKESYEVLVYKERLM
jgi:hypothetical protein